MKKHMIVAMSLLLVILLPRITAAQTTLNPTDDTYVESYTDTRDTNFDDSALFASYSNQPSCLQTRRSYLRFDLSAVSEDFEDGAALGLYVVVPPLYSGTLAVWSTGDDWNGTDSGLGDETTLTWNNAPGPDTKLTVETVATATGWVEFSGAEIANYVNSQRSANSGDDTVSFLVQWDSCVSGNQADTVIFEDREDYTSSGNIPYLRSSTPTAVTSPMADAMGPYQGDRTETITLDGRASFDPGGMIFHYEWQVDGTTVYSGPNTTYDLALAAYDPGTYDVVLRVTDHDLEMDEDATTLTVTNAPPMADADSAMTDENTPVAIDVTGNDYDPDGSIDPATVAIVAAPTHGSVHIDAVSGVITYTSNADYTGADTFSYTVQDNDGATSNAATVTVNIAPLAPNEHLIFLPLVTRGGCPDPTLGMHAYRRSDDFSLSRPR